MEILIKNLQEGDKKSSGIIEMLSNYDVEYSVLPPVLQQCSVSGALLHDLKLLEKLWYGRNPCHEANADSGEDMFWGTVACVINDYITAVGGNDR